MRLRILLVLSLLLAALPVVAHAQAGRPILTLRSYTVTPTPVRAGQEFTVEIEIYNNGSRAGENTIVIFSGGDFLPVGDAGHLLWQLHINRTVKVSQRMRAPATLSPGVHRLQVDLGANDYEGNHYDYPQIIPVKVVAAQRAAALAPPKIVVDEARTDPPTLAPGMPFTLSLALSNRGDRAASDVYLGCADSIPGQGGALTVPLEGSPLVAVDRIAAGEATTVALPLMLAWEVARGGRQPLPLSLEYHDAGGTRYQETQRIGVEVDAGLTAGPELIVERYAGQPPAPMQGEPYTLTLTVRNAGGEAARRASLAFGGEEGAGLAPLLTVDAGHILHIGDLEPGEARQVVRRFSVDQTARPQAYSVPLSVAYGDGRGRSYSTPQPLSLVVRARPARSPQLVVASYRTLPESVTPGSPLTLTVEIANVGSAAASGLLLALGGQDGSALAPFMPVSSGNVRFVGDLAAGEYVQVVQPLIVDGGAQAQAYNLPLALSYIGPEGAPAARVQRISLIVRRRVELQIEVYSRPESLAVDTPAPLSLEVRNVGRSAVDVVELRATALNAAIETEGAPFVGPLDPGGSTPVDLALTPTKSGTIDLTVHVAYRDDLNRVQIWSNTLAFDVQANPFLGPEPDAPAAPEPRGGGTLWATLARALKGLVGLGS
jgi:hypothetical protein